MEVKQVGGDHYNAPYQHWDWCAETGIYYLEGNATKYLARWRKKGGVEDLKKARSYMEKVAAQFPGYLPAGKRNGWSPPKLTQFLKSAELIGTDEGFLIVLIDSWNTRDDLRNVMDYLEALINAAGG